MWVIEKKPFTNVGVEEIVTCYGLPINKLWYPYKEGQQCHPYNKRPFLNRRSVVRIKKKSKRITAFVGLIRMMAPARSPSTVLVLNVGPSYHLRVINMNNAINVNE